MATTICQQIVSSEETSSDQSIPTDAQSPFSTELPSTTENRNRPMVEIEDLETTSVRSQYSCSLKDSDRASDISDFRKRNPASKLFGSFRKFIRKTTERASLRSPKGKRYSVTKSANQRGLSDYPDKENEICRKPIRRRRSLELDLSFSESSDNQNDATCDNGSGSTQTGLRTKTPSDDLSSADDQCNTDANIENDSLLYDGGACESRTQADHTSLMEFSKGERFGENNLELSSGVTEQIIRRFTALPRDQMSHMNNNTQKVDIFDEEPETSRKPVKHKQVAFITEPKSSVEQQYCSSMSEVESNSSSGSVPNDTSFSSSGSDISSGLMSLPSSLHSFTRDPLEEPLSSNASTPDVNARRNVRFDHDRTKRKRVQSVTETFRRVLPAYSINRNSIYRVGFAAQTWDVMKQGFRVALEGDSGFVCDHFLGKETAMGVARELKWMKDSHLFSRHMTRDPKKPSFKYACVFLLEQESCHRHVDTLVFMLYKLALYFSSDWTKVSVEISYFPRGHNVQKIPQQCDDKGLLKCVYFPQVIPQPSAGADMGSNDVTSHGGVLTVRTPNSPLRVEPVFDRLVAFWGDSYAHAVSSTRGETFNITVWLQR